MKRGTEGPLGKRRHIMWVRLNLVTPNGTGFNQIPEDADAQYVFKCRGHINTHGTFLSWIKKVPAGGTKVRKGQSTQTPVLVFTDRPIL